MVNDLFATDQEVIDTRRGNKYFELARKLKKRIDKGDIKYRLPSLPEISSEYNTTPMTAHRAIRMLKDAGVVYSEKGKGTFVSRLKRQRVNAIGSILFGILEGPLHVQLVGGIREACDRNQQHLLLEHHDNDSKREETLIRKMWEGETVDGFIIWPTHDNAESKAIKYMQQEKIPFVVVPEPDMEFYTDCHTVGTDQTGGTAEVIRHLIETGHQRIGFINHKSAGNTPFCLQRWRAYVQELQAHGLTPPAPLLLDQTNAEYEFSYQPEQVKTLREFDAVFCVTDNIAGLVSRICLREGIRIPRDLAMVGYDNNNESKLLGITSVDQQMRKIGESAAELLLEEIDQHSTEPKHISIPSKVIFRESSGGKF